MLIPEVEACFSENGALASKVLGFKARPAQVQLATAVAQAIEQCDTLVVEAGTGTGKTFAYLVPALLSGGKVLISTASKTLQDQLFDRDIPLVRAALGRPVSIALLKGRANYVCHHFLGRTLQEGRLPSQKDAAHLQKIRWFSMETQTGDKADCQGVPEQAAVWNYVTSTRENCLGSECGHHKECFVVKARREAMDADVVVVNHHLFLADTALREDGVAEFLPATNTVIFDEAHQLADIATMFFGQTITVHQWQDLLRDILIEGRATARDAADWDAVLRPLENAVRELRAGLAFLTETQRWPAQRVLLDDKLNTLMTDVSMAADALSTTVAIQQERSEEWRKLGERVIEMSGLWGQWIQSENNTSISGGAAEFVKWATLSAGYMQLHASPMDIASTFQKCREGPKRSWIFTSATLSIRNSLQHFMDSLGLQTARTMVLNSPFLYETQALMYVPAKAPASNLADFSEKLCELLWPLLVASNGGVFFLCTTLRAVNKVGQWLAERVEQQALEWTILVQGQASKGELLEQFRQAKHPILVGSASFWEGVDVKGEGLRLVIIDKLPFAPPDDPIAAARGDWLRGQGGNPFMELSVPEAAIALKQGAGRLIRDEQDRGVLVIGDRRIIDKPYGRILWQSLPPFRRTQELDVAVQMMVSIVSGV